ncbi:Cardiolipin synthase (CMP-forming) [Apodemus speciosus]|uniref:cardiolipin synthase (CMP-forming) n=1 Tax=Apodemus speciosus TaxID=105296 RepID=A0ABQ0EJE5_APOSI
MYENPWTIPNLLSMTRIGLAPVLGYLILEEDFNVALGVFALAGLTDLLDGFIARNWANQKSALGSALDPLADKVLISILYISLTYADLIPVPLTYMIISRDVMLIAAVFYVRYRTLPTPRTLAKYFNPCYATARLKPTFISKVNTAVQLILVAASLAAPVFNYADSIYLQVLWVLYRVHHSCVSIQLLSLWSENCSGDKGQMRGTQIQQQESNLCHQQQRQRKLQDFPDLGVQLAKGPVRQTMSSKPKKWTAKISSIMGLYRISKCIFKYK